jgi:hypothetical protein
MRLWLASSLIAFIASINPGTVLADCGTRGGPGISRALWAVRRVG